MQEAEIYRAYNFVLDIQGVGSGYFSEVTGPSVSIETIEYREGGGAPAVRKLPGQVRYGDVLLKWGMTESRDLWDWMDAGTKGVAERRDVLCDPAQARWSAGRHALEPLRLLAEALDRARPDWDQQSGGD